MLTVIATYHARPGKGEEIARALAEHTEATRREPGCEQFVALRSQEDPDRFVLLERYRDEAAFQAHRETEHFRTLIEGVVVPLLVERKWARYREVQPPGR